MGGLERKLNLHVARDQTSWQRRCHRASVDRARQVYHRRNHHRFTMPHDEAWGRHSSERGATRGRRQGMTRGDDVGVVRLGWREGRIVTRRQHFGKAVKAATSRDRRNDSQQPSDNTESGRGDVPMTWTITIKTTRTMAATAMVMNRKMSLDDRLGLELETRYIGDEKMAYRESAHGVRGL